MSAKHQTWGWMLAVDFFFAGMGGAMLVVAGITDLFCGAGYLSSLGHFAGPAFMGIGCCFLIFELGRPFQAWRVFMNPRAILTFGAWTMSVAMVSGFIYWSFGIDWGIFFWRDWSFFRVLFALVNVITGLVVATYPGVLLGRHKGRPFWTGPGIMGLFLLSSLVTGVSAHYLCGLLVSPVVSAQVVDALPLLLCGLLLAQGVLWAGYLWIKLTGTTAGEAATAKRWLSGDLTAEARLYVLGIGTLAPFLFTMIPFALPRALAALMVLCGGVYLRMLTVRSGSDRTFLPGEQKYRSRLPQGDEEFLKKAWL